MILHLIVSSIIIIVAYSIFTKPKVSRDGHTLRTTPDALPVLGNAVKFLQPRHVLFNWFVQCQQRFGKETFEISVPTLPPGVVIGDPESLEFVLKNEAVITKGDFFKKRSWDLFGKSRHGIINATGELWKAQRKAGLKFFGGSQLDMMLEASLPEAYHVTKQKLDKHVKDGTVVDMQSIFHDLTTMVVGQMAYDIEIDASHPFSVAFDYASDHVGLRFQNPLYLFTEIFTGSKFRQALLEVKKFGRHIVANARKRRSRAAFESLIVNEEPIFGSLIDSLMETFSSPDVVADSALNFLSAGRDTTAESLTWTLYALLRHSHSMKELQENIEEGFRNRTGGDGSIQLSSADLQPQSIPIIMATYYEALRLYPPVPFELKQCESDIRLPDGTFLPKGAIVVWCIWAMNRSTQTYGDDAESFRPSRWLDEKGNFIPRSPFEYPVFNGGSRACLGKKMAELMAAYLLINLLQDFAFEEVLNSNSPGEERVSQNSLTLPMKDGLPCIVRARSQETAKAAS